MFNINLIIDIVLEKLYPTRCIGCEKILKKLEIKSGFCKECRDIIAFTGENICMTCGRPLADKAKEYCSFCERTKHSFSRGKAVYEYTGPVKTGIYRFKYSNKRQYAKTFARHAINLHGAWIKSIHPDFIVPVPMYKKKEKLRGYNQAEVFAKELSRLSGIPVGKSFVNRVIDTKALKTLTGTERRVILENAFNKAKKVPKNADILIVDDIFTTGCTVDNVARVLKASESGNIYCLTVAIKRENM